MAKKKEAPASPFVPEEEQPYQIPENWCWIILGNAADIKRGASPRPIKSYITDELSGVNWIKIGDTDTGKYVTSIKEKITRQGANKSVFVEKGTLLLSNSMSFGRPYILNVEGCIHDGWLAITPSDCFDKEFLYYTLLASNWYFQQVAVGTAVRNLNSERVANTPVPLPPLPEQYRIVTRIESLFAKLDEAKEKAQAVVDGFELRKSAILHKVFTGELTERWRGKNDVSLTDWKQVKFGDLGVLERGRSKHRPRNDPKLFGGKYPFIQTGDVARSGMYVVEHSQTLSEIGMEQSRIFPKDTLCITIAANIGDVAILTYDCCFPDSVVGFTPNDLTSSKFIYYMMSTIQHELEATAPATAQKNINLKILSDLMINLPSISEQKEIITVLEKIFEKQQQAKESAEAVLALIDTMKKAILARAFRGELWTNDPAEEWAGKLVKRHY